MKEGGRNLNKIKKEKIGKNTRGNRMEEEDTLRPPPARKNKTKTHPDGQMEYNGRQVC